MVKHPWSKKNLFCSTLILMGFVDLFTTVVGITLFNAVEFNPLFSSLTQTSMSLFICIKSLSVLLVGVAFYKGASIVEFSNGGSNIGSYFLEFGYFVSITYLTAVVVNNMLTIFQFF